MSDRVTVHKLSPHGEELWRYEGTALARGPASITLQAVYDREDEDFHGLRLRTGDRFLEIHYADRWYNVFAVHDVDSRQLKGWYCNITRPATLGEADIWSVDLALDLILFPEGGWKVLDQDEFRELKLPEHECRAALQALLALPRLARAKREPFQR